MTTPRTLIACFAAALTTLCLLLTPGMASAAVPGTLTEQGRLFDEDGEPISGDLVIEFNLYADATDGTALWTESHNVTVEDGYFSVQLGSDTAFAAGDFDGTTRFLGITVGTDTEMSPRQAVTSVPYALHVPWGGISDFPAACATGQYLSGFDASGAPQCKAPSLSCTVRFSSEEADGNAFIGCGTGEVLTGGGCYTNGTMVASYPWACTSTGIGGCFQTICLDPPCPVTAGAGDYVCQASNATKVRAYANCCKVQ